LRASEDAGRDDGFAVALSCARRGSAVCVMQRLFFVLGALSGAIGVAASAFGAHALRGRLAPELLTAFETAARQQLVHAAALLALALALSRWSNAAIVAGGWCLLAGMLLFSGSLYALALSGVRAFGLVTPFGGVALIAGWLLAAWGAWSGARPGA
jgi:uncharacterized membrane protein YgdD (TMEM256/DUF423 family)